MAAVMGALMQDNLCDELLFNTDLTSVLLTKEAKIAKVDEAGWQFLHDAHLSVGVLSKVPQDRTIKLLTTISAAGQLLCTIAIIKDDKLEDIVLEQVST